MTISADVRETVRRRASRACEYCEVTDIDSGGILTVDHFQPVKADYWPSAPSAPKLWNPRQQGRGDHFLETEDGVLHGLTPEASFTIQRLRLNRSPLVRYRFQRQRRADMARLLTQYVELLGLQAQLQLETARLLEQQQALMAEQRALLELLLSRLE